MRCRATGGGDTVRFRVLGPVEVFDGTSWVGIGAARCRSLLAALLARAGEVFSMDQLLLELWDDAPPKTAATQVHGYIMRIRRLLGDPDGRVLATVPNGYRVVLAEDDLDATLFAAHAEKGRAALCAGQPEEAADLLR